MEVKLRLKRNGEKHKSKVLASFKNDKGKSYIDFSSETTKVGEIRLVSFVRKVS